MADPTDVELVLGAITAFADNDTDISAEQLLADVRSDPEALLMACGLAGWLVREHPESRETLREMALVIARDQAGG